jgi:hypothetical protein
MLAEHNFNVLSVHNLLSCLFLAQLFFILKMEAICSSETSVDTQRATRLYIPEDGTVHNHRYENFKSCIIFRYLIMVYQLPWLTLMCD